MNQNIFIDLLKKYTTIDNEFIDTFFSTFEIGGELIFNIVDADVARYLKIDILTLRERLRNKYSNYMNYIKNVDYVISQDDKDARRKIYLLNYQTFEKIAMESNSQEGLYVRNYFVKLREFIYENKKLINQALNNKDILNKLVEYKVIYFFVADPKYPEILKFGRTIDIIGRLKTYNTGRIYEPELKYLAIVKNNKLIEDCIKLMLKKNIVYKNTELFQISPDKMIKAINKCYSKNTSARSNKKLYEEMNELLGLYSYTKNKKRLIPYVIIRKK